MVLPAAACCGLARDLLMGIVRGTGLAGGRHLLSADAPGSGERGVGQPEIKKRRAIFRSGLMSSVGVVLSGPDDVSRDAVLPAIPGQDTARTVTNILLLS
jgi:hypothetical protein